ncbi:NAD-dependent epimerase/dehydratase family protein, partial [Nocardia sp. NPDC004582]
MRVLLTGAAGFIGSHIHRAALAAGHEVVAVDLMLAAAHGRDAVPPPGITPADVRDPDALAGQPVHLGVGRAREAGRRQRPRDP